MNIKSLAKKYDFEVSDFDDAFYEALKLVYKVNGRPNKDLQYKYFMDNLQEMENFTEAETNFLTDYYLKDFVNAEYTPAKIDVSEDEPEEVIRKAMQTSVGMSDAIGMSRPYGYKTKVINLYEDE